MSTQVALKSMGGGMISRDALKQSIGNISKALPKVATGGIDFLSMDKAGNWSYGLEHNEPDPTSVWAINPAQLQHGWIAWAKELGQAPLEEIMVSAMRPMPDVNTLPDLDPKEESKGYVEQFSMELVCVSGPDAGAHVLYKNSSVGAFKLFNVYVDELSARLDGDVEEIVALVTIGNESYIHKKYKLTFNPVLHYVEWRSPDDASPVDAPEPEVKEDKPKTTARTRAAKPAVAASEPTPEPEETPEQPAEEDEDDVDAQIAALMAKKNGTAQQAAAAADATPRRRERR